MAPRAPLPRNTTKNPAPRLSRRLRRFGALLAVVAVLGSWAWQDVRDRMATALEEAPVAGGTSSINVDEAMTMLTELKVAGPASGADYDREAQFRDEWPSAGDCDLRDVILARDLLDTQHAPGIPCLITDGLLIDPYTGASITYERGRTDRDIQIDDVVSLYNAWTTGAQTWDQATREAFATDPTNLLAVDGDTNEDKRHHDATTWTPPNPNYHCAFATTQVAVKHKYQLWVTPPEHAALGEALSSC